MSGAAGSTAPAPTPREALLTAWRALISCFAVWRIFVSVNDLRLIFGRLTTDQVSCAHRLPHWVRAREITDPLAMRQLRGLLTLAETNKAYHDAQIRLLLVGYFTAPIAVLLAWSQLYPDHWQATDLAPHTILAVFAIWTVAFLAFTLTAWRAGEIVSFLQVEIAAREAATSAPTTDEKTTGAKPTAS